MEVDMNKTKEKVAELLKEYEVKAKGILDDDRKVDKLLQKAEEALKNIPYVGDTMSDIPAMIGMVKAYITKEYDKTPLRTILLTMAALIYIAQPADLIPDFIPGLGYADDAVAILLVLKSIGGDLAKFKKWQIKNGLREEQVEEPEVEEAAEPSEAVEVEVE